MKVLLISPEIFWEFMRNKGFIRLSPLTGCLGGYLIATTEMPERLGIVDAAIADLVDALRPWSAVVTLRDPH